MLTLKLLTKKLEKQLPAYGATENIPLQDKIAVCKFFTPMSNWTWYAIEYDPEERIFFGYVCGIEKELGDFSLDEFEDLNHFSRKIERDMSFEPTKLSEINELKEVFA